MNYLKIFFKNHSLNIILTFIWSLFVIIALIHHELWADSIRAFYLIYKNDFIRMILDIAFDGHPYLWYCLTYPFVKLGFDVNSIKIVSFTAVLISVIFVLEKSPLNIIQKILFIFSAGMLYYLPVIPRNYSLIPITLFICAYLYPKRNEKPLLYYLSLILISQTQSYMYGFFLISSLFFIFERFKTYFAYKKQNCIILFSFIIYNLVNIMLYKKCFYSEYWIPKLDTLLRIDNIHFLTLRNLFNYSMDIDSLKYYILLTAFIVYMIFLLKQNLKVFLITLISFLFIYLMFVKIWFAGVPYQKVYIFILIIIYSYWLLQNKKDIYYKISSISLTCILFIMFLCPLNISILKDEVNNSFSDYMDIKNFVYSHLAENNGAADNNKIIFVGSWLHSFLEENVVNQIIIPEDKVIDNNTLDFYIKKDNYLNSKYIIIDESYKINLNYPYKQINKNKKKRFQHFDSREFYNIYEKIE